MRDMSGFGARVVTTIACIAVALGSGTNYGFSAWAPQFSDRLKLSATQTNLVGIAGNLGVYLCGLPIGIFIDARGSRPAIIVGALLMGIGYFGLHEAYVKGLTSMPLICLYSFMTGLGGCMGLNSALKASVLNWPQHRGTATGFPLAAFGLSAFFFSLLSHLLYPGDAGSFLSLLAYGTAGLAIGGVFFIRLVPSKNHEHEFQSTANPDAAESRLLTRTTSEGSKSRRSSRLRRYSAEPGRSSYDTLPSADANTAGIVAKDDFQVSGIEQYSPASLDPTKANTERIEVDVESGTIYHEQSSETSSLLSSATSPSVVVDYHVDSHTSKNPDYRGLQLLRLVDFWQIWSILAITSGVGLMTINNIGHNAAALWQRYDSSVTDDFLLSRQQMHVSIISLGSFSGRLISGLGSDLLTKMASANRLWCLAVGGLVFSVAQAIAWRLENPHLLVIVSALSGLGYGIVFGVSPSIVAERFGVHGLSQNWGLVSLSPIISGWTFNLVYGFIYDHHSVVVPGRDGRMACLDGLACYKPAYLVSFFASIIGTAITLWAIWHQRQQSLILLKIHDP